MMVELQFGVNKNRQTSNAVGACNRGFTKFVIKIKQVGSSKELVFMALSFV
jgi:hypothetical protein